MGGSPGLVVMGGDSCSEGHGFESQHHILDGYFSHLFVVKFVMIVGKDENKRKEAGNDPFFNSKRGGWGQELALCEVYLYHH